jgi:hypothetical protein
MTKDPYTPITQLISYAVEVVINEAEYCSTLIPAKAVNIKKFNIQQAPRLPRKFMLLLFFLIIIRILSVPITVRHIRRNELMPSERPTPYTSKITSKFPSSATTDPLLNKTSMRNTTSVSFYDHQED